MAKLNPPAPQDLLTYDAFRLWVAGLPDDYVFLDEAKRTTSCPVARFARAVMGWRQAWAGANGAADGFVCSFESPAHHAPWIGRFIISFDVATIDCHHSLTAAELRARLPELRP